MSSATLYLFFLVCSYLWYFSHYSTLSVFQNLIRHTHKELLLPSVADPFPTISRNGNELFQCGTYQAEEGKVVAGDGAVFRYH